MSRQLLRLSPEIPPNSRKQPRPPRLVSPAFVNDFQARHTTGRLLEAEVSGTGIVDVFVDCGDGGLGYVPKNCLSPVSIWLKKKKKKIFFFAVHHYNIASVAYALFLLVCLFVWQ